MIVISFSCSFSVEGPLAHLVLMANATQTSLLKVFFFHDLKGGAENPRYTGNEKVPLGDLSLKERFLPNFRLHKTNKQTNKPSIYCPIAFLSPPTTGTRVCFRMSLKAALYGEHLNASHGGFSTAAAASPAAQRDFLLCSSASSFRLSPSYSPASHN